MRAGTTFCNGSAGSLQVLGLEHVVLEALDERLTAACWAQATSAALDAQILQQEVLQGVVQSDRIHAWGLHMHTGRHVQILYAC